MFYVYVLLSQKNKDLYVGYSADLRSRFNAHNSGKVKSTKAYKPWKLIYYEAYYAKADATKRERMLKMHAVKQNLTSSLKYSLDTA